MGQPVPSTEGAATTLEERSPIPPPTRGRILIVEDEAALYELERESPTLVLLDLHLPQVSGFRLIQLLKQRADAPRVPVMVITALSFPEAEEAVRAGADDFITKPFLPDEVVTRVERLLERVR